jgi:hypothetical protein
MPCSSAARVEALYASDAAVIDAAVIFAKS